MRAVIFGVTGQDGSYLAELLVSKGYDVWGVTRRVSVDTTERLAEIKQCKNLHLIEGDITDSGSVSHIIKFYQPDECYNLAAQSHVATSFKTPMLTFNVNAGGVLNILEAIYAESPNTKFYQASTSEMFGNNFTTKPNQEIVQNEQTKFKPTSPYAVAKVAAHNLVATYRDAYNLHASCGILYNHESERRGETFVTRKITKWIAEFVKWLNDQGHHSVQDIVIKDTYVFSLLSERTFPKLRLGNLDAYRDWGHAADYVRAMWLILQQEVPDDYVIATGEAHSVREFLNEAFAVAGFDDAEKFVYIDPEFYRPSEVNFLRGDATLAHEKLGWFPQISFPHLVQKMVRSDIDAKLPRQTLSAV